MVRPLEADPISPVRMYVRWYGYAILYKQKRPQEEEGLRTAAVSGDQ